MSDSLNRAVGRLEIDTSQAEQAPAKMAGVAAGINKSMSSVGAGANQAAAGISMMTSAVRGLAGAFGVGIGAQGLAQLGRMAVDAAAVATAFGRQEVAARNLAGSQGKLNDLLVTYNRATGGAIDQATSLANVTKLMAVGFADNSAELDKFATAIRGISIAMGTSQDTVTQNLILELFTQRGARLDQLGLEYDKVRQRADELAAADSSLTDKQAYQNAVLEQAIERFGKLASSAEGAATGMELAAKSAKNAQLEIGKVLALPFSTVGLVMATWIQNQINLLQGWERAAVDLYAALQRLVGVQVPTGMQQRFNERPEASDVQRHFATSGGRNVNPNQADIDATKLDWAKGIADLNQQTNEDLIQQNDDYQRQRASSEDNFQKSTSRAWADFATQRTRQEQDLANSIADIHTDAARRESRLAEDLQRGIGKAQADSAERIAEAQENATERLADLEEDYQRNREKAARHFHNSLIEAAGNLDAAQVAELQRNYAEQQQDAKDAHDEQKEDLAKQLAERLDDERENLAKSIAQQQDAHDRQLQDSREADALRIQDMQDDFAERRTQEDADFNLRMARSAEDHADQLAEMERAQGLRIQQIQDHAQQERDQLAEENKEKLLELGVQNDAWLAEQKRATDGALKDFERVMNPIRVWLHEPTQPLVVPNVPNLSGAYSTPGVSASSAGTSISRTVGNISFVINAAPGMSPTDIADKVDERIKQHLESWGD
jgi:hypothetical protein